MKSPECDWLVGEEGRRDAGASRALERVGAGRFEGAVMRSMCDDG